MSMVPEYKVLIFAQNDRDRMTLDSLLRAQDGRLFNYLLLPSFQRVLLDISSLTFDDDEVDDESFLHSVERASCLAASIDPSEISLAIYCIRSDIITAITERNCRLIRHIFLRQNTPFVMAIVNYSESTVSDAIRSVFDMYMSKPDLRVSTTKDRIPTPPPLVPSATGIADFDADILTNPLVGNSPEDLFGPPLPLSGEPSVIMYQSNL
ncbi:hypothetical protein HYDPIDRAFT_26917 [Hydnomerulius pinastri MD-312]|nr:hypothetical protein HYDPIDRAFT_26917 [Hydnomerulius pinastri MD-312]